MGYHILLDLKEIPLYAISPCSLYLSCEDFTPSPPPPLIR